MGLDTVELVLAFEEAFDYHIPNSVAERMQTVRDVVEYTAEQKLSSPSRSCTTQHTFYQVRRALKSALGGEISPRPDMRLAEFADRESWPSIWRRSRSAEAESAWAAEVPWKGWWHDGPETVGDLVLYLVAAQPRPKHPPAEPWTRDEIILTVRKVIYEEQGIWKVRLSDSFVEDLRLD